MVAIENVINEMNIKTTKTRTVYIIYAYIHIYTYFIHL